MKYDKSLLIDFVKFYAVIALIPTVLLAPYFEPVYWIAVYPVVLAALLAFSWSINSLLERLGWPKPRVVRATRRKVGVKKRRK